MNVILQASHNTTIIATASLRGLSSRAGLSYSGVYMHTFQNNIFFLLAARACSFNSMEQVSY
jgi:hypothetical protein